MQLPRYLPIYIISLFLVTLFVRIVLIGYYNNNLGGIDLNVVYGIQRLLLGQPLYQDPGAGSMAVIQYTPMYYQFIAAMARLAGITAHDVQSIFVLCRVMALVFNMLTILTCAGIIRQTGSGWQASLVFSLPVAIVLTSHYYTRGDSMQLFFFCGAIWAFLQFHKQGKWPFLVLMAMAAAACIVTRQSGILCSGIVAFCLLVPRRRYGAAFFFVLLNILMTVALLIFFCNQSGALALYQNAWLGLKNGIDPVFLYQMFISRYFLDFVPFYLLGAGMLYYSLRYIRDGQYRILVWGAALSFAFAVVTGLKKGSSNNYFTEFLVLTLLALPGFLRHIAAQNDRLVVFTRTFSIRFLSISALVILITSKTVGLLSIVLIGKGIRNSPEEYARERALLRYFQQTLRISPGDKIFFTERRFLDNLFIDYSILPTKDVTSMVYMAAPGTFDTTRFVTGMNAGLVQYIVTSRQRNDINICADSLPFVKFDPKKFRLIASVSEFCIYRYVSG